MQYIVKLKSAHFFDRLTDFQTHTDMARDVIPYDAAAMHPCHVSKRINVQRNGIVSQSGEDRGVPLSRDAPSAR